MTQITQNSFIPARSPSPLGLFLSLTFGKLRPGKFWHQRSFRRKFMLRSLLMPSLSREWLTELAQWPELDILLRRQPRLPVRLHRPYIAAPLTPRQRLDALHDHYALLHARFSPAELSTYFSADRLLLATLEGKEDEVYTLELTMVISLDKEGDNTILMRNGDGDTLAEMTFTLCHYGNKRTLFIGGLQGGKRELPHEAIQKATKSCSGLFPKRLVMEAVCDFARRMEVEQILAVSNATHIYRSLRYRDKENKIFADYDAFWTSVGGELDDEGYFHIPDSIARKSEADIASKKRAEYRRRYQLLDAVAAQMSGRFGG